MGQFVRERRLALGLSQTKLAQLASVPRETVNRLEAGKVALPTSDARRRLAKALGVRHVDLLVAAGELLPEEIPAEGAPRALFASGDERAELVALLTEARPTPELLWAMRTMLERRIAEDAREGEPS